MDNLQQLIQQNKYLVWDIPEDKLAQLSEKSMLERFLGYAANMDCVLALINLIGIDKASRLYYEIIGQKRKLLSPQTETYFTKFFERYAR